jgi:hypothetical protein
MQENIAAFTDATPQTGGPPFISINLENDKIVSISVRSASTVDSYYGSQALIKMTKKQFRDLLDQAKANEHLFAG